MKYNEGKFDPEIYIKERVMPLIERASSLGEYKITALNVMTDVLAKYGLFGLRSPEGEKRPGIICKGLKQVFDYCEEDVIELMEKAADVGFEFGVGVKEKPTTWALQFEKLLEAVVISGGGDVAKYRASNRTKPLISTEIAFEEGSEN
ncbi:MAG: hypothetical protein JW754_04810 [Candidatus Aenigmarchaeota archaeon]|nr:hypothetical protein [Candidatus Aenigmarchaeota archaeon]